MFFSSPIYNCYGYYCTFSFGTQMVKEIKNVVFTIKAVFRLDVVNLRLNEINL